MNPARWFHTVSIWRRTVSPSERKQVLSPYAVVHASVRGLLEPLSGKRRESILGTVSQAHMLLTCSAVDAAGAAVTLHPGDVVVATSGPGVTREIEFEISASENPLIDTMRPMGVPYLVAGLLTTPRRLRPEDAS